MRRSALLLLGALTLCGCPRDKAPVQAAQAEAEPPAAPVVEMPPASVPEPAPLTATRPPAPAAKPVAMRLMVRNKRDRALDLAGCKIPKRLTPAQLAQAPAGLEVAVGDERVQITVGSSLEDFVRFLLGTLGRLDPDLAPDLKPYLPAQRFMGLKRIVGAQFQKDQSLLVLQTREDDSEQLRFGYLTPIGQAPGAPYVKDLEVSRRAWVAAATKVLDMYFTKLEDLRAPERPQAADRRVQQQLRLWHQVGWKLKLS